ncbi:hypothetical protein AJ87_40255 [Rhizobium yanglingense]|nr:hypothetical protein AJ87_40255 [Rhizobium yanglingense]
MQAAEVKQVLSSRAFVEQGKLGPVITELEKEMKIVWLDELRTTVTVVDKVRGFLNRYTPLVKRRADDAAVILFTSGSEGTPKGVVLTHRNILSNAAQAASRIDFHSGDKVFNILPVFHSFGLTAGTVLPLVSGVPVYFYPSPLHYRIVPELIYTSNATIIFGTDTFLSGYARTRTLMTSDRSATSFRVPSLSNHPPARPIWRSSACVSLKATVLLRRRP